MSDSDFFQPLASPIAVFKRVGAIYCKSGTVRLFLKLAILFVVPATCLLLAFVYTLLHHHQQQQDGDKGFWDSFRYYVSILGTQSIIQSTLGAIAEGAIAVAVADLYLQRHPRWFTCLQRASTKVVTLLITGFLAGVAILIGYSLFFIPGLILKINFLMVVPVVVLEDEISVMSALGRSWDLVQGERWFALKCYLGLDLLYELTNWTLREILRKDDGSDPFFTLTFQLLAMFPTSVFVPAFGILKTVLYIHLMVIKENLTEEQFANQVDRGMTTTNMPLLIDEPEDDSDISFGQSSYAPLSSEDTTVSEADRFRSSDSQV
eukprot:scaffold4891_cov140-Cylindrotheca_fusiformis.AAC.13